MLLVLSQGHNVDGWPSGLDKPSTGLEYVAVNRNVVQCHAERLACAACICYLDLLFRSSCGAHLWLALRLPLNKVRGRTSLLGAFGMEILCLVDR